MRHEYTARERALEEKVYEIRDEVEPDFSQFDDLETLPSEFPQSGDYDAEYIYIINLDHEILTMNKGIHWKLGNIPRQDDLWLRAIADSVYPYKPTISFDICPEEHMASPALELPEPDWVVEYDFRSVVSKTTVGQARATFLTHVLAKTLIRYKHDIIGFGREWSPTSFPFRELTFALVSIASGQVGFHSFPAQPCDPRSCYWLGCKSDHLQMSPGWFDEDWAGDRAPLLEFGSMSHRPGQPPGASSSEKMYWHEGVLVSLVLIIDGKAITEAATHGVKQGRTNFQIVVLSLFKVAFAEVSRDKNGEPLVKLSKAVPLSPLRAAYCVSTHPRERPELKVGTEVRRQHGELIMQSNCTGTARRLQKHFPGLAALVNFFDVAARRCAVSKTTGKLPPEIYGRILDFVDYDTWTKCSLVSCEFRDYCLGKYRLDEQTRIVAGPFVRLQKHHKERLLSFDFEDLQTGKIVSTIEVPRCIRTEERNWMPVIGCERKALMLDVFVQYELADNVPAEDDSDDDGR
ncbi:hypothetical protein FOQG_19108 [Fusarium oxysporum f. sp. raphani 54005]|uniref:F-box domain-containing protein n=3 Tax=Fusarium oxysporum TaxID=5507 RepID=X0B302_FUSOX|nr:hypothetical protein FOQG_19108 [Fusarium oxysporum f. sp. raphani 54005]EXM13613.1 hypothetical protein FOTG_17944 [Fusarium oxysporum f. sp. vasinfectum 25433]KAG7414934.1 hypothetical protein Forpi1262_v016819 [Fusarium oxysporum f. sp. raphani]KAK2666610.1 hypothetical protein RAB80_017727 [Fusarium oxysporum f. sp. vasinfectum]